MSTGPEANPTTTAPIRTWLAEPMTTEVRQAIDRLARADDVRRIAVMPDVHLASGVCIGSVVATSRLIYPQAVGSDIGCGMIAAAFDADASVLASERVARAVLAGMGRAVPVMRHRSREGSPPLPNDLVEQPLSDPLLRSLAEREGRVEFGTVGRGNHFLELQTDEEGRLWLMVHSGSRAMGQHITNRHLARATKASGGLFHLEADTPLGQAYLTDLAWARRYADLSRRRMVEAVAELLDRALRIAIDPGSLLACDHNHVQREEHNGEEYWVHRKGANPAAEGQPSIIPGSMGTRSYHVTGRGCRDALRSSSHGAGRRLGRHEARRQISTRRLLRQVESVWFNERFADGLREEAPSAYKDVGAVLRAQGDLVRVVRRLRPLLSYKGV